MATLLSIWGLTAEPQDLPGDNGNQEPGLSALGPERG